MDPSIKKSMLEYYDVHANDYDRVYSGRFPDSAIVGPDAYVEDSAVARGIIQQHSTGSFLDVPCGTGFWLPAYAARVSHAVLIDQSQRMLTAARSRAVSLGVDSKCTFLRGDVLSHRWEAERFDTMLVGFFLSHADPGDEASFFQQVRCGLKRAGVVIILDSSWNAQRARAKPKEAVVRRRSTDGREFDVYKRYFDASDMVEMAHRHGFRAKVEHAGQAFIAATATRAD